MPLRWDGDEHGAGVSDAAQLVPGANELAAAVSESRWVAEQPASTATNRIASPWSDLP
jgi:hypothetical protein